MTRDRVTGLTAVVLGALIAFVTFAASSIYHGWRYWSQAFPYISAGIMIVCGIGLLINGKKPSPVFYTGPQFADYV